MSDFSVQPLLDGWERASTQLKQEVAELAATAAVRAEATVRALYPSRTGALRDSLRVRVDAGRTGGVPMHVLRVAARHVHFVEDGTRRRVDSTRGNANRGAMPRLGPIFVPVVVAEREQFLQQAQARLDDPREVV